MKKAFNAEIQTHDFNLLRIQISTLSLDIRCLGQPDTSLQIYFGTIWYYKMEKRVLARIWGLNIPDSKES